MSCVLGYYTTNVFFFPFFQTIDLVRNPRACFLSSRYRAPSRSRLSQVFFISSGFFSDCCRRTSVNIYGHYAWWNPEREVIGGNGRLRPSRRSRGPGFGSDTEVVTVIRTAPGQPRLRQPVTYQTRDKMCIAMVMIAGQGDICLGVSQERIFGCSGKN